MKTTQRGILSIAAMFLVLFAIGIAIRAQTDNQVSTDNSLQPIAAGDIPAGAVFFKLSDYLANGGSLGGPYPFSPNTNAPLYSLNGSAFLVDDASLTNDNDLANALSLLIQPQDQFSTTLMNGGAMMTADSTSPPSIGDTNSPAGWTNNALYSPLSIPTNGLWIEVPTNALVTTNQFAVVLHNTLADELYDLLTTTNLTLPLAQWRVEQSVLGSEGTNVTSAALMTNGRSNLYVSARFGGSSDESGLPEWWQLEYFGTNGIDPYALDPSGDGLTYLDDFQKGFVPGTWHTPQPPQNLASHLDATGTNLVLTWEPGGGTVDHYEINDTLGDEFFFELGEVGGNTLTFTNAAQPITDSFFPADDIDVTAVFANGDRATSTYIAGGQLISLDRNCQFVRGLNGKFYVTVPEVPQNLSKLHVFWVSLGGDTVSVDFYPSNILNGIIQIPDDKQPLFTSRSFPTIQLVDIQGLYSQYIRPWSLGAERDYDLPVAATNFVNASAQMKENLKFLLRAAGVLWPFGYSSGLIYNSGYSQDYPDGSDAYTPESRLARGTASTNYEYYGYHTFCPTLDYSFISELRPVQENFLWRNFVYNPIDYTNDEWGVQFDTATGGFDTGLNWNAGIDNLGLSSGLDPVLWPTVFYGSHQYSGAGSEAPLPLAFGSTNSDWIFHPGNPDDLGAQPDGFGYVLGTVVTNIYGLNLESGYLSTNFVALGSPFGSSYAFEKYAMPDLLVVDYLFTSQTSFLNYTWYSGYNGPAPVMPGSPTFAPTNTSPLLITAVGQPLTVSGWAKMAIANGNTNKFAYLEQYFDQAYQMDASGNVTTNSAGLLSPYGEFFPTTPGPAALVTAPDIDTGARGTGIVNVIKLQLDVNHDKTMDLSFAGPDNTSPTSPMMFWINNDNDGTGRGEDATTNNVRLADFTYGNVRSWRNLEDFQRLWLCGLPKLLPSQGYCAVLSMSALSGNPAINLYAHGDTTGSAAYLSNTNAAKAQFDQQFVGDQLVFDYSKALGTISSNENYKLPVTSGDGTLLYTNFLFEGSGIGSGQLTLTILQTNSMGTNIIAQTSAWLELHDVKDFYERAVITNEMSSTISNWTSAIDRVQPATSSVLGDDTNIIVLVHGINVPMQNWWIEGDTVLKRLYWAGFRGKFAAVKWPCTFFDWTLLDTQTSVFNQSEVMAYKANSSLAAYLSQLRAQYPGYGLHLLVHSQGNSITSEGIEQSGLPFDTYILTQGALPDSSYDADAIPTNTLLEAESLYATPRGQPDGYLGMYTNFTNLPGRIVNYFNPLDPVLDWWVVDQAAGKPNGYVQNLVAPTEYYTYDSPFGYHHSLFNLSTYLVLDAEESRAMISRSLTLPVGQSGPETSHGVIQSGVNLHTRFNFANTDFDDHSAQWAWPIQLTLPYYLQVLDSIKP